MSKLSTPLQSALWWLLPLVALAGILGWETDWGRSVETRPEALEPAQPKPAAVALLPEYEIPGGVASRTETVERTLFNPTRRPAAQMAQDGGPSQMKKGQFALTGTLLVDGKNTAFLREIAGNKSRLVHAGETINGMRVAEVKRDGVRLTVGNDSEELVLKVATNPRPTPQPVAVAPQPAPAAVVAPAVPAPTTATAAAADGSQSTLESRRAARAAAAAAQAARGTPQQQPEQTTWETVYQRYQQPAAVRNAAPSQ
jgi:hypothetical protein